MTAPLGQIHGNILIMKQEQIPRSSSNNCTNALACAAAGLDGLCHSMTCGGNDWEPLSGEITAGASQLLHVSWKASIILSMAQDGHDDGATDLGSASCQ